MIKLIMSLSIFLNFLTKISFFKVKIKAKNIITRKKIINHLIIIKKQAAADLNLFLMFKHIQSLMYFNQIILHT